METKNIIISVFYDAEEPNDKKRWVIQYSKNVLLETSRNSSRLKILYTLGNKYLAGVKKFYVKTPHHTIILSSKLNKWEVELSNGKRVKSSVHSSLQRVLYALGHNYLRNEEQFSFVIPN